MNPRPQPEFSKAERAAIRKARKACRDLLKEERRIQQELAKVFGIDQDISDDMIGLCACEGESTLEETLAFERALNELCALKHRNGLTTARLRDVMDVLEGIDPDLKPPAPPES